MTIKKAEPFLLNRWLLLLGVFLLVFGMRLNLIELYAFYMPFWDDWGVGLFLTKSITEGLTFAEFFAPANEHRMTFNRLFSLAIFHANHEQWDPQVMMVFNSVIWALTAVVFFKILAWQKNKAIEYAVGGLVLLLFVFPLSLVNILWGVQTHTYTMVFFSVLGCWCITNKPYSRHWWLGVFALFAATLTLAGGTFASVAVLVSSAIWWLVDKEKRPANIISLIAAFLIALFGLFLIFSQTGSTETTFMLSDATTTFLKSMSWPATKFTWPAFIIALPLIALLIQALRRGVTPDRFTRFVITIFGFITVVCLAIAYARGLGGPGPARRYFEFLSLLPIVSVAAFLLLEKPVSVYGRVFWGAVSSLWILIFLGSIPWLHKTAVFTLEDRNTYKEAQERHVHEYLNTGLIESLEDKNFRAIPYSSAELLSIGLDNMAEADTLPYQLQKPDALGWSKASVTEDHVQSPFVKNGTFLPLRRKIRVGYLGEDVYGSYRAGHGGDLATGTFTSKVLRISRSYIAIPVLGYLGFPGLSLKLVNVGTGEEFEVVPPEVTSEFAEIWRLITMPIPRGYYRIEAVDDSPQLSFAFGAPRSVGRMSFYTERALENSHWVWKFGLLLLLFCCRDGILRLLKTKEEQEIVRGE